MTRKQEILLYFEKVIGSLVLMLLASTLSQASLGILSSGDRKEYQMVTSTHSWSASPSPSFRLFLDFYNTADYYDSEPNGDPRFADHTFLSDTIRPVATFLWDRFRFQGGLIAQRTFGDSPDFSSVHPWIQALWKPAAHVYTVMGNLDIPHDYIAPVFYAQRYFLIEGENTEKGLQVLHVRDGWTDDLFFNYRQFETANRQEKFDFGYVHHHAWNIFNFTYQAHWTHIGGDNFPHLINTTNDSAQAFGVGVKKQLSTHWLIGGNFYYLHSHFRTDSDKPGLSGTTNGDGRYLQAFIRYGRMKLIGASWHGHNYSHDAGDEYFRANVMHLAIAHWDVILSPDFNLFGEAVGYFIGNNDQGYSHFVKPTFTIQAAWHFAVPSKGWAIGDKGGSGPERERWDTGLSF